jgi:hypothetical protein
MFAAELAEGRRAIGSIAQFMTRHLKMTADRRPQ